MAVVIKSEIRTYISQYAGLSVVIGMCDEHYTRVTSKQP